MISLESMFGETLGNVALQGERAMQGEPLAPAYHEPVLLHETLALLAPAPGMLAVDGTLGGGGHAEALLEAGAHVIGLDCDPDAIAAATSRLARFGPRFLAMRTNFAALEETLDRLGIEQVDLALLDLGVSSHQLATPGRGFSFLKDGPLDMRMDPDLPVTAADILRDAGEPELARIFAEFGEEKNARRLAARIVHRRKTRPFERTLDLADFVAAQAPGHHRIHPATRIFQALRIAVNRELELLARGLEAFTCRLRSGGRLAVITFHSLEDRLVKRFFKEHAAQWVDRPEWPAPRRNPAYQLRLLTPKPVVAGSEEQHRNPRSRSAKLRVAERN